MKYLKTNDRKMLKAPREEKRHYTCKSINGIVVRNNIKDSDEISLKY